MSYRKELSFGLDIGDHSLKILQFRESRKKTYLEAYGEMALPDGIIKNGEIIDQKKLSAQIKALLSKTRVASQNVVIALPEAKTFLKIISVTAYDKKPLPDRVAQELKAHLPYDLSEVWWDFTPIQEDETRLTLLAGAAHKQTVQEFTNFLSEIPLTPIVLDLEALAIARATVPDDLSGCALIADIGGTKSTLIIADARTVFATVDARSSGYQLTRQISKTLTIDENAAREMKHKYGLDDTQKKYSAIVKQYVDTLVNRIKKTIAFTSEHENSCPAVSQIFLSGGGTLLKGLPAFIERQTKIPTRLGNPWIHTRDNIEETIGPEAFLRFTTVCGLALTALEHDHGS